MNRLKLILMILVFSILNCANKSVSSINSTDWKSFRTSFINGYQILNIPKLKIAYVDNLKSIKSLNSIIAQEIFFTSIRQSLKEFSREDLFIDEKIDFDLIQYETDLNLERVAIEKKWAQLEFDEISQNGLATVPNGKELYVYFLKKWVDLEVTPEKMFDFGLSEIKRVKSRMKVVQEESGMDSLTFRKHINKESFFYKEVDQIQKAFESKKQTVDSKVANIFPYLDLIPEVKISRGTNEALASVPGYYSSGTFSYNFFDNPFNKRQIAWIYIHEAMPGHHYQLTLDQELPRSNIAKMFRYSGYTEGYAAYIEEIGYEIGAYENIYDELGKWEWDIIRSVRVVLDVGLNYYGWSDEKALEFWQEHIQEKDDIALREIARMKRWPAQVITYKYGADKILKWRTIAERSSDFNIKSFHKSILEKGSLPFSVLEKSLRL